MVEATLENVSKAKILIVIILMEKKLENFLYKCRVFVIKTVFTIFFMTLESTHTQIGERIALNSLKR